MMKMQQKTGTNCWMGVIAKLVMVGVMLAVPARGAGLLIADGGFGGVLEIVEHDVDVTINNGVAVTRVIQVFKNTENRQVEALYTFPVPKGASVANFSMWINGKEMVGEVLEKERAREIYNSYKQKRRDPGLLEQVDYKTFELRIFPINAGAEQKVEISYYQELDVDHDRVTYVYPLATVTRKGIDSRTTGKFAININAKSAIPIVEIDSPSHGDEFVIARHSAQYTQASLESASGSLARDVVVSYQTSRAKTGLDVITSNQSGEDGYFYMTLTVGEDLAKLDRGMDYVFILDVSGSMANDGKLLISKDSLSAFVDQLSDEDRFEVMTFNVQPTTLFTGLRNAIEAEKTAAKNFMASQRAKGGTVLAPAVTTAYKYSDPDRVLNVVILSDGMTEQRERTELIRLINASPANARVFCIGVGNEVNRPLLEQIAQDSGGLAAFISRGDNLSRQAQAFRRKLMRPVATGLALEFKGVRVYDVVPKVMPNLYHGSPIRVCGRYSGSGEVKVSLKGDVQGVALSKSASLTFSEKDPDNPEIERMWAWHRIDQLKKTADRSGSRNAVIPEIIQLGQDYSIVTEYTSFLVLENDAEFRRWKIDRRNMRRIDRDREAQERVRKGLDEIRKRAVADLGPRAEAKVQKIAQAPRTVPTVNRPAMPRPSSAAPRPVRSRGFDFDMPGTGPVGPLFIGVIMWLKSLRRKKKA
ncbi:MAG: VIT domain-containing protein [Kiritimatiellia bacterium]|jgi:Ca-activated chloride channel family protein|nr:VIT domain-containing protein [Kiritimatiellia bacterium]